MLIGRLDKQTMEQRKYGGYSVSSIRVTTMYNGLYFESWVSRSDKSNWENTGLVFPLHSVYLPQLEGASAVLNKNRF
jgi:hypothetical protein